jgi:hypothetical protein
MKLKSLMPAALLAAVVLIASCKKDSDTNNKDINETSNPMNSIFGTGAKIPSGADGALYVIKSMTAAEDGDGYVDTLYQDYGFAWFDIYTQTSNAGAVKLNGYELSMTEPLTQSVYPWYMTFTDIFSGDNFEITANPAQWNVVGTSAIKGFNYTDNTPFPKVGFNLPATISKTQALNVSFSVTGVTPETIVCSIYAPGKPRINKTVAAGTTSVSFTAAEVTATADANGSLGVQIMPVTVVSSTQSGKSYYFVKQTPHTRFTTVQ